MSEEKQNDLEEILEKEVLYVLTEEELVFVLQALDELPYKKVKEPIEVLTKARKLVTGDN